MKVALAQINPTVGDIDSNSARILRQLEAGKSAGAQLVVFPELAVFGYPPKDLVLREELVRKNVTALERIASHCTDVTAVVGFVQPDPSGAGQGNFNSAAVCSGGRVVVTYAKMLLPTYDVFDERRYFNAGSNVQTISLPTNGGSVRVGLSICEDLWNDRQFEGRQVYGVDPIERTVAAGIDLLVNLSASPFRAGIQQDRENLFVRQIRQHGVPLVLVNQVGGNDDLIFDGASLALDASGNVIARAKPFEEDLLIVDLDARNGCRIEAYPDRVGGLRQALVLGVRDYVRKCGFDSVVIGLSGGIDSSVAAALAVEALGSDGVQGVAMPSRFSSHHSIEDARKLAENLAISFSVIPIETVHRAMEEAVAQHFAKVPSDGSSVAEENIQARIRGNILMALSNKSGSLLLTTGNKSEIAVGYCTLYGDMCGGLAVLSDVPKTVVYELARDINESAGCPRIPQRAIDKAPSAELRENQTDQDTLPPYDTLDAVLEHYVEHERGVDDIVDRGFDRTIVERVARMVDGSEYKRKQAPVGIKVTSRAFGTGRRMPIAASFR